MDFVPLGLMKLGDLNPHFDIGFALGMKMASGIPLEGLDPMVESFNGVGGSQMVPQDVWIVGKRQIVIHALTDMSDPCRSLILDRLTQGSKLFPCHLHGGGEDFFESWEKKLIGFFLQVATGIPQEMDRPEWVIGQGKESSN